MVDTGKVNTGKENDRTGKLPRQVYRKQLLGGLGLRVSEEVVQAVIDYESGYSSLKSRYQLYTNGRPTFKAAKQTIYKIKRLYDSGALMEYVNCLDYERMASSYEVGAPTQLTAIQEVKSDEPGQGLQVQFPPPNFAPIIKQYLDNEQAKISKAVVKVLDNYSLKFWGYIKIGTVNLSRVERSH